MYQIPRPGGVSWGERMKAIAEEYPNPSEVPGGVPMAPGTTEPPQTWKAWAKSWRDHYDTTAPVHCPPPAVADGKPTFPPPGASDAEWSAWAKAINAYYTKHQPFF